MLPKKKKQGVLCACGKVLSPRQLTHNHMAIS